MSVDRAPITTHCHACEGRHPMAVSDPMPKRPMDSLPYFAGMTKNGDSDGAQARSVGPESGPQGEGGEVRPVWTRKGKFCARLGRLGEVFEPLEGQGCEGP